MSLDSSSASLGTGHILNSSIKCSVVRQDSWMGRHQNTRKCTTKYHVKSKADICNLPNTPVAPPTQQAVQQRIEGNGTVLQSQDSDGDSVFQLIFFFFPHPALSSSFPAETSPSWEFSDSELIY